MKGVVTVRSVMNTTVTHTDLGYNTSHPKSRQHKQTVSYSTTLARVCQQYNRTYWKRQLKLLPEQWQETILLQF